MRLALTLAAAGVLTIAAADSFAQQPSARMAVRAAVVRSCAVQTGADPRTPAQVSCSRGAGPDAIQSVSSVGAATESIVNAGAPQPVTDTASAETPAAAAAPAVDDAATSTEWPTETGAVAPTAAPRPAYQVVTINF